MNNPSIAVVGAGKVGSALAILLHNQGYTVSGVTSRTPDSARNLADRLNCPVFENCAHAVQTADLVFITTPDREIGQVSAGIASEGGYRPGQIVAHTSGAHPAAELLGATEAGAKVLSFHPLQSFAEVEGAMQNLPGSFFALEGDDDAVNLGRKIVEDLGGKSFVIKARDKGLYHAAACIASNYLVSVMHLATGVYQNFGLSKEEAFEALLPLVWGTVENIHREGPVQALTGPVARGDVTTIEGHMKALNAVSAQEKELYRQLGNYTVQVGLEKGTINVAQAEKLYRTFKGDAS
ncbi:MAG: DUF2520 domain-containing protein [Firmicutes bacterium]|nr:DUF2520 domain-containing protein [Bacillota bacterium]